MRSENSEQLVETPAATLFIRMRQGHKELLKLDLPAQCVRLLSTVLPCHVKTLLAKYGVDLAALERRYQNQALSQGSVLARSFAAENSVLLVYLA